MLNGVQLEFPKREKIFVVLAALFFCFMTLLNILGITRFVQLGPFAIAIGVLPYPLTFLITDLISELYGKSRANFVVWVGLGLNIFIFVFLFFADLFPSVEPSSQPPWQNLNLKDGILLATGQKVTGQVELFKILYSCASGAVFASMVAYVAAQFIDVQIFHFLKKKTKGKALWLRNNVSTMVSQLLDSIVVISVTFGQSLLHGEITSSTFITLLMSNYLFKWTASLLDTLPMYYLVAKLKPHVEAL